MNIVFSSEHIITASGDFSKPCMTEVHGKLLFDNILRVNFFEIVMHVRAPYCVGTMQKGQASYLCCAGEHN